MAPVAAVVAARSCAVKRVAKLVDAIQGKILSVMLEEGKIKREIAERQRERVLRRRPARLRPRQYQHLPIRCYPYDAFNKQNHLVHRLSKFQVGNVALVRQLEVTS